MAIRGHSPQDEIHGPLRIPPYCWPIIDTPEYQRMRHIPQLGMASLVYLGATHTRLEHCLGCAHIAVLFMENISRVQPELNVKSEWTQAVVIAALCHDIGHGPWSHCFEVLANLYDPRWDHEENGGRILRHIVKKYNVTIDAAVIDAACSFIRGEEYQGFPKWLSRIVSNPDCGLDIDKFDYISRDMNRSLSSCRFEYDRLIVHCRVVDDQLAWKLSEIRTIERLFFNRNDMHERVYQHRVKQSFELMIVDMLLAAEPYLGIEAALTDPTAFCAMDCRLQYTVELGQCGEDAQRIAQAIQLRRNYKCVAEIRLRPNDTEREEYSQRSKSEIIEDISQAAGIPSEKIRLGRMIFNYGLEKDRHPLLKIPFWRPDTAGIVKLTADDLSSITPAHFRETGMRVFVTDPSLVAEAGAGIEKWKAAKGFK
jgi:HD superfamily phosphohydrolase